MAWPDLCFSEDCCNCEDNRWEAAAGKRALSWEVTGAQTTAAGWRGEEEEGTHWVQDGLEPGKRHCYNLFLMRNIINLRDQRGPNQTPSHFTREEKVQKRRVRAGESDSPSVRE